MRNASELIQVFKELSKTESVIFVGGLVSVCCRELNDFIPNCCVETIIGNRKHIGNISNMEIWLDTVQFTFDDMTINKKIGYNIEQSTGFDYNQYETLLNLTEIGFDCNHLCENLK